MATASAATSKKAAATPIVKGVALAKVKAEVVDKYLAQFGLPKVGSLADKVNRLAEHIRRLTPDPETNIVECDNCDGPSCAGQGEKVSTDVCPFCGDGDEPAPMPAPQPPKADGKPAKAPAEPVTTVVSDAKGQPLKAALAVRAERAEAARSSAPVGYAKLMERFVAVRNQVVVSYWELGRICHQINEEKAFLDARDKDGKPKYGTFDQFCAQEIHMTPNNVYRLMRVAVAFTSDVVQQIGTCKLDLILRVPDDVERMALVERAKKGATLSELELEILGRTDRAAAPPKNDDPARPAPAAPKGLTATFAIGRHKLEAWSRSSSTRRARSLSDEPWATWELPNGVMQRIVMARNTKGELEFLIEVTKSQTAPAEPKTAKPAKVPKAKAAAKQAPKAKPFTLGSLSTAKAKRAAKKASKAAPAAAPKKNGRWRK